MMSTSEPDRVTTSDAGNRLVQRSLTTWCSRARGAVIRLDRYHPGARGDVVPKALRLRRQATRFVGCEAMPEEFLNEVTA
jgi:hypothetical protein